MVFFKTKRLVIDWWFVNYEERKELESPQNIHRLIAIPIEGEVKGAEGTGVVELREIDLVGEVGDAPVALLGGVPAMARVATKWNKQQIPLVESRLQVWRDLLIECPPKRKNHGTLAFQQVVQNLFSSGEWKPLITTLSVWQIDSAHCSANCVSCGVAFREAKNATNRLSSKSLFPDKSIKKAQALY